VVKKRKHNSTFAIGGVSCSADSFVVAESSVLRMNICAVKLAHRKAAALAPRNFAQKSPVHKTTSRVQGFLILRAVCEKMPSKHGGIWH
jgi:uncharacterized membrane protein